MRNHPAQHTDNGPWSINSILLLVLVLLLAASTTHRLQIQPIGIT
jgi:hypothetical protein